MTEPTILCPQCKAQVKLTESLAAPLVEATRRDYERRMAQLNLECSRREDAIPVATIPAGRKMLVRRYCSQGIPEARSTAAARSRSSAIANSGSPLADNEPRARTQFAHPRRSVDRCATGTRNVGG